MYNAWEAVYMCLKFSLLHSGYHDFNQYIGPPEWTLNAEAYRRVLSVNPIVPDGIVFFEVPHIRQPYVGG
jgi:hypothetical protein